jgi:hypothetical protein
MARQPDRGQEEGEDEAGLTINVDALAGHGPTDPRPESKAVVELNRLSALAPVLCLAAWVVFVVAEVIARLVSAAPGEGLQLLIVGGLGSLLGGVVTFLALGAKRRDREAGKDPSRVLGVAWTTRWLIGGVGFMVLGTAAFLSVG